MAIRGQREYERFNRGEPLTHKQAILAQCFICNGLDEGGADCKGKSCPLYQFMPYRAGRVKRQISEAEKERLTKQLKLARKARSAT
ncbi:MAG: hypothetical protein AAB356_05795 [Deltaproteobacteria bacterium]